MKTPIRILVIDDFQSNVSSLIGHLEQGDYEAVHTKANTMNNLNSALDNQDWDIILCHHRTKNLRYQDVLKSLQDKWLDIPVIIISDDCNEEFAATVMRAGANDCVNQNNLSRLVPVIERELRDAEIRQEHQKAKRTIKTNEEFLKNIIETSLDGIIAINNEGKIVLFNHSAVRLFKYQPGEIRNQSMASLLADPARRRDSAGNNHPAHSHVLDVFLTREIGSSERTECTFRRKDGSSFEAEVAVSVGKDERGFRLIVLSLHDITESNRIEERLKEVQKMEAIGILAGGVAHDFNNYLTVILGYADMILKDTGTTGPTRDNTLRIKKAGEQAALLTRELLAFGRKQTLQAKTTNLNSLISEQEKMLTSLLGEDIQLSLILTPQLKNIKVDTHQLGQILMNLVINAKDAMVTDTLTDDRLPKGKAKITIKTENIVLDDAYCMDNPEAKPGDYVRLSIEDIGKGMDKKTMARIFEPFFTTKEPGKGTGLGLSVVYGITKQHNGWINVYSEIGHGTIFRIYLPTTSSQITTDEQQKLYFNDARGKGERILLLEDEPSIREFAANVLRTNGYSVYEASSAQEARKIFHRESGNFNMIFSDIVLTDGNGIKLVNEFLLENPDIGILLSSGYMDHKLQWAEISPTGSAPHSLGDGAKQGHRFLQKPYNIAELLANIRETVTPVNSSALSR